MVGYVHFCTQSKGKSVKATTSVDWFNCDRIIAKVFNDCIEFSKPTLDYKGVDIKTCIRGSRSIQFALPHDLPLGRHEIDEEDSNEDLVVVYF